MVNVFRVTLALCLDVFLLKFNLPRVPRFLPFSQASLFLGTEIFSGIPLPLSPYQCHKVSSLYLTLLSNRRNLNNVLFLWPQCEAQGGFETRLHWNSIWGGGLYWVGVFVTRSISLDNLDKEMIFTQGVCTRIYPGPDVLHSWGRNNSSKESINIPNDIVIQTCFNLVLSWTSICTTLYLYFSTNHCF